MASAAVFVSVMPALAARTATAKTSRAFSAGMDAERMSYRPPASASVDSPNSTAMALIAALYASMCLAGSSSMVATLAICCSKSAKTLTPAAKGTAATALSFARLMPMSRTDVPKAFSRAEARFRPRARRLSSAKTSTKALPARMPCEAAIRQLDTFWSTPRTARSVADRTARAVAASSNVDSLATPPVSVFVQQHQRPDVTSRRTNQQRRQSSWKSCHSAGGASWRGCPRRSQDQRLMAVPPLAAHPPPCPGRAGSTSRPAGPSHPARPCRRRPGSTPWRFGPSRAGGQARRR